MINIVFWRFLKVSIQIPSESDIISHWEGIYNEPLVSISCTTYNHKDYISDALDSFLMQKTNFPFEILIHDDASTDGTQDIIRKYFKKFPNIIKPILQKENQFQYGKRMIYEFNHTRASGKYVALCEGDDFWSSEWKLQKQVNFMEKNTNCVLLGHSVNYLKNEKFYKCFNPVRNPRFLSINEVIRGGGQLLPTPSVMYKKPAMDNPPSFYFESNVGDRPLYLYLATKGKVYCSTEVMATYRYRSKGSWTSKHNSFKQYLKNKIKHNKNVIETLQSFNNYTNFKYNQEIIKIVEKLHFEVAFYSENYKSFKKSDHYYYFTRKKSFEKFKLLTLKKFPVLYLTLGKIIAELRN